MKFRVTKKAVREGYPKILAAGYCSMQHLLRGREPIAYSTSAYGWDCNYYEAGPLLISTGYRPARGTVAADYTLIKRYEDAAREVWTSAKDYETKKAEAEEILKKFVEEVVAK